MRVGIIYPVPEPLAALNWSGTPHGLASGFISMGADVVPLGVKVPRVLHEAVALLSHATGRRGAVADRMQIRQWARTNALRACIAEALPLDAVVAMGTEMYDLPRILPAGLPIATYDDGTLLQMYADPLSDISQSRFPARHVSRWIDRQKRSSRAAHMCCVSTDWAAASFVADYNIPSRRVAVVGMGHRPRRGVAGVVRDWTVPRFLFVGVDWQRKNGNAVLEAFREVRHRYPEATLDIVGNHPALDVPGVTGHGFLSRVDAAAQQRLDCLYAGATCFVLPSRFDPSPIAYLEAASSGLPVIATTRGGAGSLLKEGALVVEPNDREALVAAMLTYSDPTAAARAGAAAADSAAASSWTHVALRIGDALGLDEGRGSITAIGTEGKHHV
ncbi:glycosyltransferase [Pseudarthrobacter phenanthrenivorans Sphe3]|uniref:Glycosyltransferase n=1 Tax=Pseudarthrobacter phenanthrenivorans (strain DSM 18606 / JCM 16027 / LMG 23796 / Sphe3) TaxID=930171 RepID=F0MA44_PSEPM|nr:glycosyltransferase family 4 protein [Pseudarthrobacter phenanthrenivorans]ADX75031.1 glycosyltransferase [Pseudarthrobacter phenanthrenivorans Sphe3]